MSLWLFLNTIPRTPIPISYIQLRSVQYVTVAYRYCNRPFYTSRVVFIYFLIFYFLLLPDSSESGSNKCSGRTGSDGPGNSRLGSAGKGSSDGKPTRVRTVLNEKQLHTLRTCYSANPRPDALMKEQLVEMTGLSPRVIRVWFQNKRCKDKKRAIALKQQIQQDKVRVYKYISVKRVIITRALCVSSSTTGYNVFLAQQLRIEKNSPSPIRATEWSYDTMYARALYNII